MKKLIDDLRMIQAEHIQVDAIRHKLSSYREELDRKIINKEQLMGKADVRATTYWPESGSDILYAFAQRAKRQEHIAEEKYQRTMQHAEERRARAQDELARLQRDYSEMAEERKENERMVEETKAEAAELERKVRG